MGYGVHRSTGDSRTILGVIGERREEAAHTLEAMLEVEKVVFITRPFKLAGREFHPQNTVIDLGPVSVGGADGLMIELHPRPQEAFSDGPQTLNSQQFAVLMQELKGVAACVGRAL